VVNEDIIQKLKNSWRNCNASTRGFAQVVPSENWHSKAFEPSFKSFSWEFACLARTRLCYIKGLETGKLDFSPQEDIPSKEALEEKSKSIILEFLNDSARTLLDKIENLESAKEVDFIVWLLQHERIHHGKLLLYVSKAKFKLPETFVKTWGESNFPQK